jgi:hypothetical protein
VALPDSAPANVVVVRVAVLGLNVSLVLETFWGKFPVVVVTHVGYIVAAVAVSSVIAVLVAFVAVVAVVALPDRAPENVVVASVLVLGTKVRPVAVSAPWFPLVADPTKAG